MFGVILGLRDSIVNMLNIPNYFPLVAKVVNSIFEDKWAFERILNYFPGVSCSYRGQKKKKKKKKKEKNPNF